MCAKCGYQNITSDKKYRESLITWVWEDLFSKFINKKNNFKI